MRILRGDSRTSTTAPVVTVRVRVVRLLGRLVVRDSIVIARHDLGGIAEGFVVLFES